MNEVVEKMFMERCFELALKGFRTTNKNPMVGAVLVHDQIIIGEGYHQKYGEGHAEVHCFHSVSPQNEHLISESTLFVSLEPCSFHGKTPACSKLIIEKRPKRVIIATLDPHPQVSGSGIAMLENAGIQVKTGVLEKRGKEILRKFEINLFQQRPYIALKWAQSKDNFAGKKDQSIWLTNSFSKLQSHVLRSKFEAILVGSNTVILDNPSLNNRLVPGQNPIKVIIDRFEKISKQAQVFLLDQACIVCTQIQDYKVPEDRQNSVLYFSEQNFTWNLIFKKLYELGISSILIEGGPTLQKDLINNHSWDEAHVLSSNTHLNEGIKAPKLVGKRLSNVNLGMDRYDIIVPVAQDI